MDMSTLDDNWSYLISRLQAGLGGYGPDPLIAEVLKILLRNKYEGMIIIDRQGRVAFMDKPTEKLFGLVPGAAKGRPFSDFFRDLGILEVLETGVPQIGRVQEIGGQKKIVTRFPIIRNGEVIGAVGKVIFHEIEAIKVLSDRVQNLEVTLSKYRQDYMAANRASYTFDTILGISPAIAKTKEIAGRIASADCSVLLVGESGTGKELFAHSIHNASTRASGPFVRVNCPSIPFDLVESELFGYEKGAFTGASQRGQKGKFELASGGTIFLDEISSMPLTVQAKLLRVIQEKEIQPLGSSATKRIDFRLLAATNVDLRSLVKKGSFRADLYYRLSSVQLLIPPLRRRPEDVAFILNALLPRVNRQVKGNARSIAPGALACLSAYDWPGNVREMINVLEQAVLNGYAKKEIDVEDLPEFLQGERPRQRPEGQVSALRAMLSDAEREAITDALQTTGGNKRKAARMLGISRAGFYKKIGRLRIG
jgi:transcriptional regulator with PAS, ATPase and Fis domain